MMPNPIEVSVEGFVKMNILLWNCRSALNADFKKRVLEMVVNHLPALMVIDVHEIYIIKYSHIYIFNLTFMLFCD